MRTGARTKGWALLGIAALSVACGGADEPTPAAAADAGAGDVVAPELLAPPPSGQGFQIGTQTFTVDPGTERQLCYFVRVPAETDVFVKRITLAQEPGSHHLNVYRVNTIVNLSGEPGEVVDGGECWNSVNWKDWPLVINSQQSQPGKNVVDWTLPEGVASKFEAGELLMLQSHYVNATTQKTPGVGHAVVNFWTTDAAQVKAELGTVFATNQNIKVCPGDSDKKFTATCRFAKTPVTIVGASGHFHSRGREFDICPIDPTGTLGADFYTSTSWDDPPFLTDLSIPVAAGGGISWTCDYAVPATTCGDPENQCCFTFGGRVESQEHCNAFIYYYPKQDDIACF